MRTTCRRKQCRTYGQNVLFYYSPNIWATSIEIVIEQILKPALNQAKLNKCFLQAFHPPLAQCSIVTTTRLPELTRSIAPPIPLTIFPTKQTQNKNKNRHKTIHTVQPVQTTNPTERAKQTMSNQTIKQHPKQNHPREQPST